MSQVTLDDLARSVHQLSEAVVESRQGLVDEQTVRKIAEDVLTQSAQARRNGPMPGDTDGAGGFSWNAQARALRKLQGRDRLDGLTVAAPEVVAEVTGRSAQDVRHFQQAADGLVLLGAYMRQQAPDPHEFDVRHTSYFREVFRPAMQAMDTATTAEGTEYVPRLLSGSLIERIQLELVVPTLFPMIEMPSNPFDVPGLGVSRQRTASAEENIGDSGQTAFAKLTAATRKVTLTAKKLGVEILTSKELEEDAIVDILPMMTSEIVDYLSADIEDGTINGDTAATHQDSDVTAGNDPRKLWSGLRKTALASSSTKIDGSNGALTAAMLRGNRKAMKKYGARSDQLAHVISIANYVQLLGDSAVLTLQNYGPRATILAGELAKVDNVPVIISEYARTDLNASGVYDGTTTSRSAALTVNVRGFMYGSRRDLHVQILRELYAEYDQDAIVASLRRAFTSRFPSTEPVAAVTYNLST